MHEQLFHSIVWEHRMLQVCSSLLLMTDAIHSVNAFDTNGSDGSDTGIDCTAFCQSDASTHPSRRTVSHGDLFFPSLNWSHSCVWHAEQHAASVVDLCVHSPCRSLGIHEDNLHEAIDSIFPSLDHPQMRMASSSLLSLSRKWNICACSSINLNDCQSVIDQNWRPCTSVCSADSVVTTIKIQDRLTVGNTSDRWSACSTLGLVLTLDWPCPPRSIKTDPVSG